jgi:hypothetical protein
MKKPIGRGLLLWVWVTCLGAACGSKPAAEPEPAPSAPAMANQAPAPPSAAEAPAAASAPHAPSEPAPRPTGDAPAQPDPPAARSKPAPKETATAKRPEAPAAVATPDPQPAAPAARDVPGPCGAKDQPSCPLEAWMEEHLKTAFDAKDFAALAEGLNRAASFTPDPSWDDGPQAWPKLARDAANAAKQADLAGVQSGCKACHKAWRAKYKQSFRKRAIAE